MLPRRVVIGAAVAAPIVARAALRDGQLPTLDFDHLYKSFGVRGMEFSDRVRELSGQKVAVIGYMAPPLKAESKFFVLSREPLAICPFCDSDANWPLDIVVIYLKYQMPLVSAGARLTVVGRLESGSWLDPESGFVSLLRLVDADFHKV